MSTVLCVLCFALVSDDRLNVNLTHFPVNNQYPLKILKILEQKIHLQENISNLLLPTYTMYARITASTFL